MLVVFADIVRIRTARTTLYQLVVHRYIKGIGRCFSLIILPHVLPVLSQSSSLPTNVQHSGSTRFGHEPEVVQSQFLLGSV